MNITCLLNTFKGMNFFMIVRAKKKRRAHNYELAKDACMFISAGGGASKPKRNYSLISNPSYYDPDFYTDDWQG